MCSYLFGGSKPPPYEKFVRIFEMFGERKHIGRIKKEKEKANVFRRRIYIRREGKGMVSPDTMQ